jgi:arylsulfatase A-like enzyme
MIWAGPGVRQTGQARTQPVELLDIYPTLVELCGLPQRDDLEGLSLGPLLRDASSTRRPAVSTYEPDNHAVITELWRYIRYNDGGEELYDRVHDPNEWKNLAADPAHTALKRDLAQWMPKTSVAPVPDRDAYDFDFETYTYKRK